MKPEKYLQSLRPLAPLATGLSPRGRLPENIRCVLFDVYGTLLVSASGDIAALAVRREQEVRIGQLLADFQIRRSPVDVWKAYVAAIEGRHAAMRQQGVDFPEVRVDEIWQTVLGPKDDEFVRTFAVAFETVVNPVYPMPGLKEMLKAMQGRGILMGIVSNAQFYTPLILEWFLGGTLAAAGFDPTLIFFSYRAGRAKPSPHLFREALQAVRRLGVSEHRVLYVGNNMRNDIRPSHAQGFRTALFAGDQRSLHLGSDDPHCHRLKPDLVLTDLRQLPSAVSVSTRE